MATRLPGTTKGDRTRQRILAALKELLAEVGYEHVTIAAVTRRAEVTRPAFYFHFDTLGAAFSSLMEHLFDEFTSVAEDWYEHRGPSQADNLRTGMAQTVDVWRTHALVLDAVMRAAATDISAARILDEWIAAFTARALPVVRADSGEIEDRPTQLTDLLVAMSFDAMRRDVRKIVSTNQSDQDLAACVAEIWIRTIYGRT